MVLKKIGVTATKIRYLHTHTRTYTHTYPRVSEPLNLFFYFLFMVSPHYYSLWRLLLLDTLTPCVAFRVCQNCMVNQNYWVHHVDGYVPDTNKYPDNHNVFFFMSHFTFCCVFVSCLLFVFICSLCYCFFAPNPQPLSTQTCLLNNAQRCLFDWLILVGFFYNNV